MFFKFVFTVVAIVIYLLVDMFLVVFIFSFKIAFGAFPSKVVVACAV